MERSLARASELAAVPARSFALTKGLLRRPVLERIERLAAELDPAVIEAWACAEVRRAISGFVERTLS